MAVTEARESSASANTSRTAITREPWSPLRSVKLRRHRGPLYTVPFGELGAVESMSRDWVIDKVTIGVTYDTDLDKARKLIKHIGKQLEEDPEYKPHIIKTLKMQGVSSSATLRSSSG